MTRYLLDTGIAQDFINYRHGVRERVDDKRHLGHRIGICVPVLGELWAGPLTVILPPSRDCPSKTGPRECGRERSAGIVN
jgi:hypothetical protein